MDTEDGELVAERFGCPQCGELRMDFLAWTDDETVKCASCGCTYQPGEPWADEDEEVPA